MRSGNGNICIPPLAGDAAVAVTIIVSSPAHFQQIVGADRESIFRPETSIELVPRVFGRGTGAIAPVKLRRLTPAMATRMEDTESEVWEHGLRSCGAI